MANVETSGIPYYEEPKPVLAGEATMAEMMRTQPFRHPANTPTPFATSRESLIATETTREAALAQPLSPSQSLPLRIQKATEERDKTRAQAEADERKETK